MRQCPPPNLREMLGNDHCKGDSNCLLFPPSQPQESTRFWPSLEDGSRKMGCPGGHVVPQAGANCLAGLHTLWET